MGIKSALIQPFARHTKRNILRWSKRAVDAQEKILRQLINRARDTTFGKHHRFNEIRSYRDFVDAVPVRDYEQLKDYIDRIRKGEKDILWPGRPRYFAKTSGTTSGVKYIPITTESIPNHIHTARNALFNYYAVTGNGGFFDGKMIFLSGSPELAYTADIPTGRLSGIVNHLIPSWVKGNQLPDYETNCIEDWEEKLEKIVELTYGKDMRLISGIPPWVQMYYERLLEKTGKETVGEVFPNYSLFVYGGVNYSPYREKMRSLVGRQVDGLETYPASEGFIAFQDQWNEEEAMLLNCNSGIFFEFIPVESYQNGTMKRLSLAEVEKGINYLLVLSSNAGLWAYDIGDTVEFSSLEPPRLRVTGRIKHFISAFGEHVIAREVEQAMVEACRELEVKIQEFTVAPQVNPPEGGLPYHEWFVAFDRSPEQPEKMARLLDEKMTRLNIYYDDLIRGNILRPLVLRILPPDAFQRYMQSVGKLGGQNKVPRLSNDRGIADALSGFVQ